MKKKETLEESLGKVAELKPLLKGISILSRVAVWLMAIAFITLFLFGTLSTLYASINGLEAFQSKEFLWEMFLEINSYGETEGASAIEGMKVAIIIFEIALPYFVHCLCYALLGVCCGKVGKFVKGVNTEEELFTQEKLNELKKYKAEVDISLFICAVMFTATLSFVSYFLIIGALEVITYLFNQCVMNRKPKKETKKKVEK